MSTKRPTADLVTLRTEYDARVAVFDRFREVLVREVSELLAKRDVDLSVPVQHRTKTWQSIADKVGRKVMTPTVIQDVRDLVGLRLILQFRRDIDTVDSALADHFVIVDREDTGGRLNEDQFGYSSVHILIATPESWLAIPTMQMFHGLVAEVQVRTTAQHIWAGASHVLQYKQEQSVPVQLRRSIYRVSALLETVDLELERLLAERQQYIAELGQGPIANNLGLDVDLLQQVLDSLLPARNKSGDEDYAEMLRMLRQDGADHVGDVEQLIRSYGPAALSKDRQLVSEIKNSWLEHGRTDSIVRADGTEISVTEPERLDRDVFLNHQGLLWHALAAARDQQGKRRARPN